MKSLITCITLTLSIACIFSCHSDNKSLEITTTLIANNNLFGNGDEKISEQNFVIEDESSWKDLMDKMNSVNIVTDKFTETEIDFDEFIIIAAFDQIRGSGGHQIVVDITEGTDTIIASITHINPQGNAATVITQPYYIVKITTTDKPIIFE